MKSSQSSSTTSHSPSSPSSLKNRCLSCVKYFCLALIIWIFVISYYSMKAFPEVGMVLNSQCKVPIRNWDGKILVFQVWDDFFKGRSPQFNIHAATSETYPIDSNSSIAMVYRKQENKQRPVILWGSHHKTGTYLAQKVFAHICEKLSWCCIFHVTRDSVYAIEDSLLHEDVHVLGHSQWIWYPEELGVSNYKFIHFYRKPNNKIISGFRYHYDGSEGWTKKKLTYARSCQLYHDMIAENNDKNSKNQNRNFKKHKNLRKLQNLSENSIKSNGKDVNATLSHRGLNNHHQGSHEEVTLLRSEIMNFCETVHLCETCCRREHEVNNVPQYHHNNHQIHHNTASSSSSMSHYTMRSHFEYNFLCKYLSFINESLQISLQTQPLHIGLGIESAVDYFESLRMAKIYNHTISDPRSLNVDLDEFMSDYRTTVLKILTHIEVDPSQVDVASLFEDLQFYDVNNSPIYKFTMSNPMANHINNHRSETPAEMAQILGSGDIAKMYAPINELLHD